MKDVDVEDTFVSNLDSQVDKVLAEEGKALKQKRKEMQRL